MILCGVITTPLLWALGLLERPPGSLTVTGTTGRAVAAVGLCVVGWAAVAVTGLHVPSWPAALPWLQLATLGGAAVALVGPGTRHDARVPRPPTDTA